ncbi:FAD-binding domain-containing protein [Aspergillus homomorphus CBS 101889]|uniref:FAD-binding domain-containing protein n=1 Tax=Aspergillus homomorphus (strain CBS 101889) TaxID=1450537 RepID=A0A395HZ15_ASPHC|nr:FAD-binding domain-containing protein [Aspergillus homomorphus CBS 101889]RAL12623.1 FAD-binding domain-containing protein [Aspergillus homomorphus CBS 101889]
MPRLSCRRALELKTELHETRAEVITPSDETFAERVHCLELSSKEAGAIVQATTTDEVSRVISYATKHRIPVVVHGGAYATGETSSTEGGIIISLARMAKVVVDPASRTLAAQGGARWEDIDRVAAASGLSIVEHAMHTSGDADIASREGYGWMDGRHGSVIDNLVSVKLVLADGRIVTASDEESPDLFWAVREAGHVFGLATELVFRAYPNKSHEGLGGQAKGQEVDLHDGDEWLRLQKLKRQYDPDGVFGRWEDSAPTTSGDIL